MRFTIIALAASLVATATAAPLNKRIIGGGPVLEGDIPYIVEIQAKSGLCTGFLVDSQTIMTAARCLKDKSNPTVYIGNIKLGKGTKAAVSKFVVHPNFDDKKGLNDIALIFLSKKASVTPSKALTSPGAMPKSVIKNFPKYNDELNKVSLNVDPTVNCKSKNPNFNDKTQFCTRDIPLGHSACDGDWGGPVFSNNRLVGLVSRGTSGIKCSEKGSFQYFTYIKPFISWAKSEISKN
ncbi:Trypsin-2 [Mortierella sp. NVP85]|nr:Trypsin-2 [Mortierella sp. NVP85]